MVKNKTKTTVAESDGSYVLKLVLYLVVGSQWLWVVNTDGSIKIMLPIGLFIGILFARHERFQLDRKIEYALLLVAVSLGFWGQIGLYLN